MGRNDDDNEDFECGNARATDKRRGRQNVERQPADLQWSRFRRQSAVTSSIVSASEMAAIRAARMDQPASGIALISHYKLRSPEPGILASIEFKRSSAVTKEGRELKRGEAFTLDPLSISGNRWTEVSSDG